MLEVLSVGRSVYHRSTNIKAQVIFKGFNRVGKAIARICWRDGESKEFAIDLEPC